MIVVGGDYRSSNEKEEGTVQAINTSVSVLAFSVSSIFAGIIYAGLVQELHLWQQLECV